MRARHIYARKLRAGNGAQRAEAVSGSMGLHFATVFSKSATNALVKANLMGAEVTCTQSGQLSQHDIPQPLIAAKGITFHC